MASKNKHIYFFLIVALFDLAASFAHPVTPVLIKNLHLEDYMFGLALACMMLGNFLFSPFWGKLSSYISSRNTLLISCSGYALGQVFFALSQTKVQFLLARFVSGVFCGGIFVAILTYIVNTAPDEKSRGKYLVFSATLQAVCNSLGYFIGGMLGEIGVYVSVIAQAVTLALCGILFRVFCSRDASISLQSVTPKEMIKQANPFLAFLQGRKLMTSSLALLFFICALQYFSQTAYDQSFNYYVIDQVGLSTGYNGLIKFVMGIVTLVANCTLCVWLMHKTDLRKSTFYVLLASTLSITSVLFIKELAPFMVVNVIFFAMSAISTPMTQDIVARDGKGYDTNLVMGFYNSLKSFGGIIGALVAGFTYVISPTMPFIACAAGFGIAAVCTVIYRKRGCTAHQASSQIVEQTEEL